MPRENSLSDSEGRSLTPDPEEEGLAISPVSPTYGTQPLSHHDRAAALERIKTHSRKSLHSHFSRARPSITAQPSKWAHLPPREKFKAAVRKIVSIRRGMTFPGSVGRIGAEPGVDPRRPMADATYGHLRAQCEIEVVDYSAVRSESRKMTNPEFATFLNADSTEPPVRKPWVKVRWINIGGVSWDVIKPLAIKYNLHPLALEDVVKGNPRPRSKADYYTRHLFLRVLCHQLGDDSANVPNFVAQDRTSSPEPIDVMDDELPEKDLDETRNGTPASTLKNRKAPILPTHKRDVTFNSVQSDGSSNLAKLLSKEKAANAERDNRKKEEVSLKALKHGERVEVDVSTMYIFLFRDGTVISIHPTPSLAFTSPISHRLKPLDTVLRKSADPSLLVHAILDIVVDRALQVIDRYHADINKYEHDILLRPKMKTVRLLHILSGDLILHKRTMEPIKTLVYGLRRYDIDRCAALIDTSDPNNKDTQVVGFMSHKAKIYLADVYDHMEYILTSMDMFAGIAENLIGYTFNMASYEMNEVMRRLTLATIIFLPLTVLTGYFGMNFTHMWSVNDNSDIFFWYLAIPLLVLVIVVSLTPDMKKLWHYVEKRSETKKMIQAKFDKTT